MEDKNELMRLYVDFNTMMQDEEERVRINTHVHKNLVDKLRPGLPVLLHDEGLAVEAVIEFDAQHKVWWARPNWSMSRDLPYPRSRLTTTPAAGG